MQKYKKSEYQTKNIVFNMQMKYFSYFCRPKNPKKRNKYR